jgi:mono/diheme cytochrome c family protein
VKTPHEKLKRGLELLLVLGLAGVALPAASRQIEPAPGADQQFTRLIHSVKGPDLFRAYCAPCHGLDAKGDGPAASALKGKVPDLTLLARNNHGQFPAERVREAIMGDKLVAAHGSREMPMWGPIFHQVEADVDWGNVRLANLVEYLQTIQSITVPSTPSGAELYNEHCAVCHGGDLKGTGPVPFPYRAPPNLTTLAKRHGGKFPEAYVENVLRNGVVMPEHGPAEMPIWGADFAADRLSEGQVALRIKNLTDYIKARQVK